MSHSAGSGSRCVGNLRKTLQLLQSEISKDPLCGSQNILDSSCCKDVTKLLKDIVASFPSTDKSSIQSKEEDTSQPVQLALDEALKGTLGRCGWDSENASFNSENQPSVRKLIYELSNYVAYGSARSDNVTNCNSFLSFLPDALLQRVAVTSAAIVSPQAVQSSKKSDISDNAYQELKAINCLDSIVFADQERTNSSGAAAVCMVVHVHGLDWACRQYVVQGSLGTNAVLNMLCGLLGKVTACVYAHGGDVLHWAHQESCSTLYCSFTASAAFAATSPPLASGNALPHFTQEKTVVGGSSVEVVAIAEIEDLEGDSPVKPLVSDSDAAGAGSGSWTSATGESELGSKDIAAAVAAGESCLLSPSAQKAHAEDYYRALLCAMQLRALSCNGNPNSNGSGSSGAQFPLNVQVGISFGLLESALLGGQQSLDRGGSGGGNGGGGSGGNSGAVLLRRGSVIVRKDGVMKTAHFTKGSTAAGNSGTEMEEKLYRDHSMSWVLAVKGPFLHVPPICATVAEAVTARARAQTGKGQGQGEEKGQFQDLDGDDNGDHAAVVAGTRPNDPHVVVSKACFHLLHEPADQQQPDGGRGAGVGRLQAALKVLDSGDVLVLQLASDAGTTTTTTTTVSNTHAGRSDCGSPRSSPPVLLRTAAAHFCPPGCALEGVRLRSSLNGTSSGSRAARVLAATAAAAASAVNGQDCSKQQQISQNEGGQGLEPQIESGAMTVAPVAGTEVEAEVEVRQLPAGHGSGLSASEQRQFAAAGGVGPMDELLVLPSLRLAVCLFMCWELKAATPPIKELADLQSYVLKTQDIVASFGGCLQPLTVHSSRLGGTVGGGSGCGDSCGMESVEVAACWGVPLYTHQQDPHRALAAAAALRSALSEMGLRCSFGLATGQVYCGLVGSFMRREYAVVGNAASFSARLARKAGSGHIYLDESTFSKLPFSTLQALRKLPHGEVNEVVPVFAYESNIPLTLSQGRDFYEVRESTKAVLLQHLENMLRPGRTGKHNANDLPMDFFDKHRGRSPFSPAMRCVLLEGKYGAGKKTTFDWFREQAQQRGVKVHSIRLGAQDGLSEYRVIRMMFRLLVRPEFMDEPSRQKILVARLLRDVYKDRKQFAAQVALPAMRVALGVTCAELDNATDLKCSAQELLAISNAEKLEKKRAESRSRDGDDDINPPSVSVSASMLETGHDGGLKLQTWQILDVVRDVFGYLLGITPVVFIVSNVHFADERSLKALLHLQGATTHSLLVLSAGAPAEGYEHALFTQSYYLMQTDHDIGGKLHVDPSSSSTSSSASSTASRDVRRYLTWFSEIRPLFLSNPGLTLVRLEDYSQQEIEDMLKHSMDVFSGMRHLHQQHQQQKEKDGRPSRSLATSQDALEERRTNTESELNTEAMAKEAVAKKNYKLSTLAKAVSAITGGYPLWVQECAHFIEMVGAQEFVGQMLAHAAQHEHSIRAETAAQEAMTAAQQEERRREAAAAAANAKALADVVARELAEIDAAAAGVVAPLVDTEDKSPPTPAKANGQTDFTAPVGTITTTTTTTTTAAESAAGNSGVSQSGPRSPTPGNPEEELQALVESLQHKSHQHQGLFSRSRCRMLISSRLQLLPAFDRDVLRCATLLGFAFKPTALPRLVAYYYNHVRARGGGVGIGGGEAQEVGAGRISTGEAADVEALATAEAAARSVAPISADSVMGEAQHEKQQPKQQQGVLVSGRAGDAGGDGSPVSSKRAVQQALTRLVRDNWLLDVMHRTDEFQYSHPFTYQVLYHSIPSTERDRLHRAMAAYLESHFENDPAYYATICMHYSHFNRTQALEYALKAVLYYTEPATPHTHIESASQLLAEVYRYCSNSTDVVLVHKAALLVRVSLKRTVRHQVTSAVVHEDIHMHTRGSFLEKFFFSGGKPKSDKHNSGHGGVAGRNKVGVAPDTTGGGHRHKSIAHQSADPIAQAAATAVANVSKIPSRSKKGGVVGERDIDEGVQVVFTHKAINHLSVVLDDVEQRLASLQASYSRRGVKTGVKPWQRNLMRALEDAEQLAQCATGGTDAAPAAGQGIFGLTAAAMSASSSSNKVDMDRSAASTKARGGAQTGSNKRMTTNKSNNPKRVQRGSMDDDDDDDEEEEEEEGGTQHRKTASGEVIDYFESGKDKGHSAGLLGRLSAKIFSSKKH